MNGLNKLYFLKLEINEIKEEIENLTELGATRMTGMPFGSGTSDPTTQFFMKKNKLMEKLNKKLEKYIDELNRIEIFIDSIDNDEVRLIARLRFIQNLKWEEISKKVNYDRSVCYRKLKEYLKRIKKDDEK